MTDPAHSVSTGSDHDPGGKVRLKLPADVMGAAQFSGDGRCRFTLSRWIGSSVGDFVLWIGMNPSTADASVNDPTVCREWGFTTRFGLKNMIKMNVSPYRATNPKDVITAGLEDEYAFNLKAISDVAANASIVVMAHGVLPKSIRGHGEDVNHMLLEKRIPLRCLGVTKDGHPRHPLYLRSDTPLVEYSVQTGLKGLS